MQTNWQSYIVGGAVRDRLLGLPVYDYDHVVVGATPQDLIDLGYTQVGKDFPVFLHPQSKEEYALARTERKAGKGYTGFAVHAAPSVTLEQDLERRDLTINAIAERKDGQLIDPFNGQQDLRQRLLRHISPAFAEDPLRVIRLARFRAHLGHLSFTIDPTTKQLAQQLAASGELQEIAIQRLWHETYKAMQTPSPWEYFATLLELGALAQIAPALAKLLLSRRNPLGLLKLACEQLTDPNDRLAILLHSLNKPQQEALGKDLSLPKNTLSLCVQLSMHQRKLLHYPQLDPTQRFMLLHNCGALKDTSLINRLIKLCGIIHSQGQMELPNLSFGSSLQQIIDADLLTIKAVTAKQYIAQGLEGKALGEALKAGQIAALAAAI